MILELVLSHSLLVRRFVGVISVAGASFNGCKGIQSPQCLPQNLPNNLPSPVSLRYKLQFSQIFLLPHPDSCQFRQWIEYQARGLRPGASITGIPQQLIRQTLAEWMQDFLRCRQKADKELKESRRSGIEQSDGF